MNNDAQSTFEHYAAANAERNDLFSNFMAESTPQVDNIDDFKLGLLKHLSMSIFIKESRTRYQKEQFDRLMLAQSAHTLKGASLSLDSFAEEYCRLIEYTIDKSNNFKCPKIRANYDDYEEATIRPMNSTVFYFFFSGDKFKRNIAQWLLSSVRYPNEKVRRAYMRFFA